MDLDGVTGTVVESIKNGELSEDFKIEYSLTESVNEIRLKSINGEKNFHILVLETIKDLDLDGGED